MKEKLKQIFNRLRGSNKALKASFWFVFAGFMQRGISTLTTPIFTRILDTAQYGVYNSFLSWLDLFSVIITLRLYNGIYMKGLFTYKDDRDNFTTALFGLTDVMSIFWLIIYLIFQNQINGLVKLTTPMMFCMFILIITESWFGFWSSRERVDFNYKNLVIVTIIIALAKPIFGIAAVLSVKSNKVLARIISLTIVELLVYLYLHIKQLKKSTKFFNKEYWLVALKYNIVLVPHFLSQRILSHSDRVMIRNMVSDSAAGIYSLAYSLAMVLGLFNTAFLNSMVPWNYRKLEEKDYDSIKRVSISVVILIAFINLAMIIVAPEILTFFAPKSYHEALYVIPPVSISVFLMFVYGLFASVEMFYSKNNYTMIASVIGAISNIIANFIFIPKYGYIAAAYSTVFSYFLYCLSHMIFVKITIKEENIEEEIFDFKILSLIFVGMMAITIVVNYFYNNFILRYAFILLLLIIVFITRNKWIVILKSIFSKKENKNETAK